MTHYLRVRSLIDGKYCHAELDTTNIDIFLDIINESTKKGFVITTISEETFNDSKDWGDEYKGYDESLTYVWSDSLDWNNIT